jgi:hypothetical protein
MGPTLLLQVSLSSLHLSSIAVEIMRSFALELDVDSTWERSLLQLVSESVVKLYHEHSQVAALFNLTLVDRRGLTKVQFMGILRR